MLNASTSKLKEGKLTSSYTVVQSEPEQWQETFQTNLTAQYFVTAAFLPLLAKGRDLTPGFSSSVCNIASISGVMKGTSSGQFAYATSKAGFIHMRRLMATTFAEAKAIALVQGYSRLR